MQTNCYVNFNDILKENLKSPEFQKQYKKADRKIKLQIQLNELLQTMGINDLCVQIVDIDDY